jgi:hypothetical protein
MHTREWEKIGHVLRTNSKARTDIQCLTLALIARESELREESERKIEMNNMVEPRKGRP